MQAIPTPPEREAFEQVMKCVVCGGERTVRCEWRIIRVLVPRCRLCGGVLVTKEAAA